MKETAMPACGVRDLLVLVLRHRRKLVITNLIALGATIASVPVPSGDFGGLPGRRARALKEKRA